jgi:hypothetical protein
MNEGITLIAPFRFAAHGGLHMTTDATIEVEARAQAIRHVVYFRKGLSPCVVERRFV